MPTALIATLAMTEAVAMIAMTILAKMVISTPATMIKTLPPSQREA